MNIRLVIFDFDGTIMDTKETIVFAKQETMRQMGLMVADEDTCAATIGMSAKLGFKYIYPEMSDDMLEICVQRYREIFNQAMEIVPSTLFPDMAVTLDRLNEKGIICTISTSRSRKSLVDLLEKMNIYDKFSYLLAAEDTEFLKPNAEPVLKTLAELGIQAKNTLVIGDMPADIQMGKNAGVYTCGVSYGISSKEKLIEAGADYIIDGINDLCVLINSEN